MKTLQDIKTELIGHKPFLFDKYKIQQLGIYGSFLRNEQTMDSDLDILIDYSEAPSLVTLIEIQQYLSAQLGITVDLVTKRGLKSTFKSQILSDIMYI